MCGYKGGMSVISLFTSLRVKQGMSVNNKDIIQIYLVAYYQRIIPINAL